MNSIKQFLTKQASVAGGLRSLYKSTVSGENVINRFPVRTPFNADINKHVLKSKWFSRNTFETKTIIQSLIPSATSSLLSRRELHESTTSKKRPVRKKRTEHQEKMAQNGYFSVNAFATAEEYDLEKLVTALKTQDLYEPKKFFNSDDNSESEPDVLHVTAKYQVGDEPRDIYFFREGTVVLWNCSDMECSNLLVFLKTFEEVRILNFVSVMQFNDVFNVSGQLR